MHFSIFTVRLRIDDETVQVAVGLHLSVPPKLALLLQPLWS